MDPEEREFWSINRSIVESLVPYDYCLLLLEGKKRFSWSGTRVSFLKRWWWKKFGEAWQNRGKQDKLI